MLNHLKAKTVRLHSKWAQLLTLNTHEASLFQGKSLSIFHLLQMQKRHVLQMITSIIDKDGVTQTTIGAFCTSLLRFCTANTN
jgi:hypothetical protein